MALRQKVLEQIPWILLFPAAAVSAATVRSAVVLLQLINFMSTAVKSMPHGELPVQVYLSMIAVRMPELWPAIPRYLPEGLSIPGYPQLIAAKLFIKP